MFSTELDNWFLSPFCPVLPSLAAIYRVILAKA